MTIKHLNVSSGYHWILPVNDFLGSGKILYTDGPRICSCRSFQLNHSLSCVVGVSQLASVRDCAHKMTPVSHGDRQRTVGLITTRPINKLSQTMILPISLYPLATRLRYMCTNTG